MTSAELEKIVRKANWFDPLLDIVKRLAAGWNTEHLNEFGCRTDEENRPFPESSWKHQEAMAEVLDFLKQIETHLLLPEYILTSDQLVIVHQWRKEYESTLGRRSDTQIWKDCQELDELCPGYIHRLMNRRPLPWEEDKP